jgi:hypothetical protein
MTDTDDAAARLSPTHQPGLVSRLVGVLFTPRQTFADVVRQRKWLGALIVVTLATAGSTGWLTSTELGQQMVLERQVEAMESFGLTITDEMYDQLADRVENSTYLTAGSVMVMTPILYLIIGGVVWTVCYVLLGAHAPFRAMYAVVAHAGVVGIVQQLFQVPLNYARGVMSSPTTLAAFAPMLEPGSFLARLLGAIDLFVIWQLTVFAIGVAVLYGKRTGPIATIFYMLYAVIAVVIAFVFTRIGG